MDRPVEPCATVVSLRRLFSGARFLHGDDIVVRGATDCSRVVRPGRLFAVICGSKCNGADFVAEALERGAAGLLVEQPLHECVCPQCVVPNVRAAYARLCAAIVGDPSQVVKVLGVTGTNGKTTVTWMLRSILKQAGYAAGVLGTVEYHDGLHGEAASLTTPDSRTLSQWLARMAAAGTNHAAIELSSHALHQDRAAGTVLQAAAVTNITQDHFDYHGTFDEYRRSKARIAELLAPNGALVLNRDDLGSWAVREIVSAATRVVSFGLTPMADVAGQIVEESLARVQFRLSLHGTSHDCRLSVIGRHNVANALAAAAMADHLGIDALAIVTGLDHFRAVPGRLERIDAGQPFDLFVDYAHTDDALRRCLQGLRSVAAGRLICVFGAGGDRDRTKRPLLGRAAALADVPIITSDNPRSEDPLAIIDDILAGLRDLDRELLIEPDRAAAIETAISIAQPGDCILVAGKGHEREQIIGNRRLPFDDRAISRSALREWNRRHTLEQACR
jgi:UDP-N-acetylmuramoyl-L-alanyl-D-glutamate--2,6-diaminopimelate ligase